MGRNKDLMEVYDTGKLNWHSGYEESIAIAGMVPRWKGRAVLEIGCGEGNLASILAYSGAEVFACDYSSKQIIRAKKKYGGIQGITFFAGDYRKIKERFDIIVMQGVIEHFDKPEVELPWIVNNLLKPEAGTRVILSVPHWWNPRGFILQTLRLLLDAPISLTDLHYFLPGDIKRLAAACDMLITEYKVVDESWGAGHDCIADLRERIPKCCPDIPKERLDALINWLKIALLDKTVAFEGLGASAIYRIER